MKLFFIQAQTGCSCCANDNFIQGPYKELSRAQERAKQMSRDKVLASQYAENGVYDIFSKECEILTDGRIICDYLILPAIVDDGFPYFADSLPYLKDRYDLDQTTAEPLTDS